jgi:hypothetical protein
MKTIRNVAFVVLLALVLLTGGVKAGASPQTGCPANCTCLGLDPPTTFVQIDCTGYQECEDHANLPCGNYCRSIGSFVLFDTYAYGDCLATCSCWWVE